MNTIEMHTVNAIQYSYQSMNGGNREKQGKRRNLSQFSQSSVLISAVANNQHHQQYSYPFFYICSNCFLPRVFFHSLLCVDVATVVVVVDVSLFDLYVNACVVINQFLLLISEVIDVLSHALMLDSETLFHNA